MADCGLCVAYHEDYRVVFKNEDAVSVVITNPYNAGHLIILPRRHVLELGDLTANESLAVNQIINYPTYTEKSLEEIARKLRS